MLVQFVKLLSSLGLCSGPGMELKHYSWTEFSTKKGAILSRDHKSTLDNHLVDLNVWCKANLLISMQQYPVYTNRGLRTQLC